MGDELLTTGGLSESTLRAASRALRANGDHIVARRFEKYNRNETAAELDAVDVSMALTAVLETGGKETAASQLRNAL